MKIPTISELVKGDKTAKFQKCDHEGNLWYAVVYIVDSEVGINWAEFQFPITRDEVKGGNFHRNEKAITLMRWIRKHVEYLNAALETSQNAVKETD